MEESVSEMSDLAQSTEAENEVLVIFAVMVGRDRWLNRFARAHGIERWRLPVSRTSVGNFR